VGDDSVAIRPVDRWRGGGRARCGVVWCAACTDHSCPAHPPRQLRDDRQQTTPLSTRNVHATCMQRAATCSNVHATCMQRAATARYVGTLQGSCWAPPSSSNRLRMQYPSPPCAPCVATDARHVATDARHAAAHEKHTWRHCTRRRLRRFLRGGACSAAGCSLHGACYAACCNAACRISHAASQRVACCAQVPEGHTFKGFPIQFTHLNAKRMMVQFNQVRLRLRRHANVAALTATRIGIPAPMRARACMRVSARVHVRVRACVRTRTRVTVCACVRACVRGLRECVRTCACVHACARACLCACVRVLLFRNLAVSKPVAHCQAPVAVDIINTHGLLGPARLAVRSARAFPLPAPQPQTRSRRCKPHASRARTSCTA
jgi:hypothetical protein